MSDSTAVIRRDLFVLFCSERQVGSIITYQEKFDAGSCSSEDLRSEEDDVISKFNVSTVSRVVCDVLISSSLSGVSEGLR